MPDFRNGFTDEDFAYFLGFDVAYTDEDPADYSTLTDEEVNYPFIGGNESAYLGQYAAESAIVTSTNRLYTFTDQTLGIRVYDNPTYSPGEILLQAMTYQGSQSTPLNDSVKLYYRTEAGGDWILYEAGYTNTVSTTDSTSNFFVAWEWDTSSLLIYDYYIQFDYELAHSSFAAAQLDTSETYDQQLDGYGLNVDTNIPYGLLFGLIEKSPEKLIYEPWETVTITADPNANYEFVKWVGDFGESTDNPLEITIAGETDVQLILAPRDYTVWRQIAFPSNHGGGISSSDWAKDNDYDGDALSNVMEYALGGEPENPTQEVYFQTDIVAVDDVNYPAIVFRQQVAADDLTYSIAVSSDLSSWLTNADVGGPYTSDPEIIQLNDDGTQLTRVRSLTPLDAATPTPFIKVNISFED
ncbi:InlB B-repeat-containing protein [Cerasicoccus maritimus]|uniref:InlB B-repeat-containing protein n=1 Tax=Cerasicoccus maritimus TaxID=490089 RepID=UPI002852882E|nr:hypothetical protein [Cerasicoccus maritimus]